MSSPSIVSAPPLEAARHSAASALKAEPTQVGATRLSRQPALPVAILGVPFDNVTTAEVMEMIDEMIRSGRPHYFATANIDFLVQARSDVELRRILFDAHLVLCDGTPLLWASRLLGNPLRERVAGSDLAPLLIRAAAEKGYRLFFLGGSPDTTAQAVARLRSQFPAINVAGFYSPPFAEVLEMDHAEITRRIREARPDLLFVSFGCPKQEKWLAMHYETLGVPVAAGVGGTIDFLAGRLSRAPNWMRRTGTEWIYRLAQEPKRLARRYWTDLWCFGQAFLAQWWCLRFWRARSPLSTTPNEPPRVYSPRVVLPARLDLEAVERCAPSWTRFLDSTEPLLLEISNVQFIDSTGVALLIRLQNQARKRGQRVLLVGQSAAVERALRQMRLDTFFTFATGESAALQVLQAWRDFETASVRVDPVTRDETLVWKGEVTAANAERVWKSTEGCLQSRSASSRPICLELGELTFIDSTGVGLMVRAKKMAGRKGATIKFLNVQPAVRNVIQLCRLESFLLEDKP